MQKPELKAIALTPEFPEIELTADTVSTAVSFQGGQIKNIENDGEKSAAGLPDYKGAKIIKSCLLYTSPSPRDSRASRMPSSA